MKGWFDFSWVFEMVQSRYFWQGAFQVVILTLFLCVVGWLTGLVFDLIGHLFYSPF